MGLDNNATNPRSILSTPITMLKNEGRDTICSGVAHEMTLSRDHAEDRRLKFDVGCQDPTTKGVISQHL